MDTLSPPFDPWLWSIDAGDVAWASLADPYAMQELQTHRLRALVEHAQCHSPAWRRLLHGIDASTVRLQDLPVTSKPQMMRQFDEWVTDPQIQLSALRRFTADPGHIAQPFLGRYMVWQSSGSSGDPAMFVQDSHAMAVYDALEALRRPWPARRWVDPWFANERIVFVGATGGHFAGIVTMQRLRRLNAALAANLVDVSFLQPTADLVQALNALEPTILSTYPSMAVLLAQERVAGHLKASLQEVWTGGETLTAPMRRFVQESFDCPVIDSYGASEFLCLASQCVCGQLHLNSDWAILESIDDKGSAAAPGTLGATTLLTNLANRLQPLIRYDLGDQVALHTQACDCGSNLPVIEIQGRHDETLCIGSGKHVVRVVPLALCTVLEDEAGLFDFQLTQLGASQLLLETAADGTTARESLELARSALERYLKEQGVRQVHIDCHAGRAPKRGASGKVQRVVRLGHRTHEASTRQRAAA